MKISAFKKKEPKTNNIFVVYIYEIYEIIKSYEYLTLTVKYHFYFGAIFYVITISLYLFA